jgi:hypothetical protein
LVRLADQFPSLLPISLDVLQDHVRERAGLILRQHAGWIAHPRLDYGVIPTPFSTLANLLTALRVQLSSLFAGKVSACADS